MMSVSLPHAKDTLVFMSGGEVWNRPGIGQGLPVSTTVTKVIGSAEMNKRIHVSFKHYAFIKQKCVQEHHCFN